MKRKLRLLLVTLCVMTLSIEATSITSYAWTYEEIAQWALENGGVRVQQGGTYDEYSTCPGEITPNSKSTSPTNTTPTETKSVEVPKQPVHEHSYIETVTTEPTCVEEGIKTFTCSCGDKYTEPIEVVAHDYSKEIITQEPTCTANGKKLISCSVCNDTYEEDIKSLGHEKGEWVTSKRATCTENGEEVVNCKRCGEMLETKEIEASGHIKGEWHTIKKATLFNEGLNELRCDTCEEVLETEVIPINMNNWGVIIIAVSMIIIVASVTGIVISKKKRLHT